MYKNAIWSPLELTKTPIGIPRILNGNCFVSMRFLVQNLPWSLEFGIHNESPARHHNSTN